MKKTKNFVLVVGVLFLLMGVLKLTFQGPYSGWVYNIVIPLIMWLAFFGMGKGIVKYIWFVPVLIYLFYSGFLAYVLLVSYSQYMYTMTTVVYVVSMILDILGLLAAGLFIKSSSSKAPAVEKDRSAQALTARDLKFQILTNYKALLDSGEISQEDFDLEKKKLLNL